MTQFPSYSREGNNIILPSFHLSTTVRLVSTQVVGEYTANKSEHFRNIYQTACLCLRCHFVDTSVTLVLLLSIKQHWPLSFIKLENPLFAHCKVEVDIWYISDLHDLNNIHVFIWTDMDISFNKVVFVTAWFVALVQWILVCIMLTCVYILLYLIE